jgi:hypothetical protein
MADPIKYKDIFKQDKTTANIKGKNAETRAKLLGNESLSRIMGRSMQLIKELMAAEKPYIPELEKLAVETVTNMYPIIKEAGIKISVKLGAGELPGGSGEPPEETDKLEHIPFLDDEVAKRRLINAITQGASIQGALEKPFIEFLEDAPDGLLERYSKVMDNLDNSISKYGESLKKIFGIFYDEQAIAMMLAQLAALNAPGKEMKGGESDVEVSEDGEVHIRAAGLIFPILIHEIIKGLYELISLHGFTGDADANAQVAASDDLTSEPEDMSVGTIIKDGLDELYRNAKIYNKVPFEMFLVNLYKTEAVEFREFIEDLINGDLSAGQKVWAEGLMQPPQDEEQDDDDYEYR